MVDPYLPLENQKVWVMLFAGLCFAVLIVCDAWMEFKKKMKKKDENDNGA